MSGPPDSGKSPLPLLFLVADTGGGHRASATAIARQLLASFADDTFDIHVIDPFAQMARWPLNRASSLYGPVIRRAPWLWGAIYHATNTGAAVRGMRSTVLRSVMPGLADVVATLRPAVVVSFHPLLNHVAARVCREGSHPVPFITVITDLYNVHSAWMCPRADAVVTASPSALGRCRRAGVPADRCFDFGLPVDPSFTHALPLRHRDQTALRSRLDLPLNTFTVLLMGGSDGSGRIEERARALADADLDIQLIVISGRNQRLKRRLAGLSGRQGRPVRVEGFVDNMADWIGAADLVASKAGPGTIAESLCCGVPLLLTWYIPGQERGNIDFVVATGTGRFVPTVTQLIDAVAEMSAPGSPALVGMREAVRHAARPEATTRIAKLIMEHALPGTLGAHPTATPR